VKRAKQGKDGNPIGLKHKNPLFDTREYSTVEFPDGSTAEYQANIIAENLFSQSDSEGRQFMIMEEISDHTERTARIHYEQAGQRWESDWLEA
jgi:hypothetical protein